MSRYAQNFALRCRGCYEAAYLEGIGRSGDHISRAIRASRNIEAVRWKGDGVVCRCGSCGKESVRYSRAARHEMERTEIRARHKADE